MNNKLLEFKEILEKWKDNINLEEDVMSGAIEKHVLQEVIDEYMLFFGID